MVRKALALAVLLCLFALNTYAQDWPRYLPKKQRDGILKKSLKSSGVGGLLIKSAIAGVYWVTEPVARSLVSQMVDRERLTNEEADQRYAELRKESIYTFAIYASAFVAQGLGRPNTVDETVDPIGKNDFFLQREDNRKIFSKAIVERGSFDIVVNSGQTITAYTARLAKVDRSGQPIIQSLNDKIEVQFSLAGKTFILDYKVKDLVTKLEDL